MKKPANKNSKHKRLSWDEYFLAMINCVGARATCDKGGSGCVITKDNRIVSTGYTGSMSGLPHCNDEGHHMKSNECLRTIHAEQNALTQALKFGISLSDATMYCEVTPCKTCQRMATSLGIKRIVVQKQ